MTLIFGVVVIVIGLANIALALTLDQPRLHRVLRVSLGVSLAVLGLAQVL